VCDQETSKNEEAEARYRAVENTTTMGCNARKTNKQTTNKQFAITACLCIYLPDYNLVNVEFKTRRRSV
jgi:hypothetical protein